MSPLPGIEKTSAKAPKIRRKLELSDAQQDQIRQAFDIFDQNGTGAYSPLSIILFPLLVSCPLKAELLLIFLLVLIFLVQRCN
jgi:hypothetical protein